MKPIYSIICEENTKLEIYYLDDNKIKKEIIKLNSSKHSHKKIPKLINQFSQKNNLKIIASGIISNNFKKLASNLWLDSDIVPFHLFKVTLINKEIIKKEILNIKLNFRDDISVIVPIKKSGEIKSLDFLVKLDAYKKYYTKEKLEQLKLNAKEFENKEIKMAFFNSTSQGGGVALMRHAMMRLFKLLNLDIKWYLYNGNKEYFKITKKKIHNVLQGIEHNKELTNEDLKLAKKVAKNNFEFYKNIISKLDIIVIDDPQPSFMIPLIKKQFPNIKIIYRSHIFVDTKLIEKENTVQKKLWEILYKNIKLCDKFIAHPIKEFVPENIDKNKLIYMPPSTDPLDGLNKLFTENQEKYYLEKFNQILKEAHQTPLDLKRDYLIQIARFDPSKGIDDVIESYKLLREKLEKTKEKIPQLVLIGNGAADDPEGEEIYFKLLTSLRDSSIYQFKDDIKIAKIPYIDQILNVLLKNAKIVLQLSTREGFEVKVTESLFKGKPTIVYNEGGLILQTINNFDGFEIKPKNIQNVSQRLFELLTNKEEYKLFSKHAIESVNYNYFTIDRVNDYVLLGLELQNN